MPTYNVELESTYEEENEEATEDHQASVYLHFYIPNPGFEVKREYLIYDLGSLAGDVGGMGGILLGISIGAIYDRIKQVASKALDKLG